MKISITVEREFHTFGDYLRFVRLARFGETLQGMANIYGCSRQYIDQAERDFPVSLEVMASVLKVYKISADDIELVKDVISAPPKYRKRFGDAAKDQWVSALKSQVVV